MSKKDIPNVLGVWKGYRIGSVQRFEAGEKAPAPETWIELLPNNRRRMKCSSCGRLASHVHDYEERWGRDLPILGARTNLLVWRRRVACPNCGPKLE